MSVWDGINSQIGKLHSAVGKMVSVQQAEVTSVSPLRVRPDYHTLPLDARPANYCGPLHVGDRVIMLRFGRRAAIIGKAGGYPPHDYSTTEQDTGRKWVDGKPIYQRTFQGTITAAANVRHWVTLVPDADSLIDFAGSWKVDATDSHAIGQVSMNDAGTTVWSFSYLIKGTVGVAFATRHNAARTDAPYTVTVLYTKV